MTRDEAIELLGCNLSELADSLGITTAAVARWNKEKIPRLREYQIRDIAAVRLKSLETQQNVAHANN
ncbi:Cro/CI family transcriptional regulator [Acinetobacter johnsonii]|uniref:Cro/CI family transcriptional regulator n=1 Tax=Acinetobacter johnsonii TaxID=40214 RepID=UPI00301A1BD9